MSFSTDTINGFVGFGNVRFSALIELTCWFRASVLGLGLPIDQISGECFCVVFRTLATFLWHPHKDGLGLP